MRNCCDGFDTGDGDATKAVGRLKALGSSVLLLLVPEEVVEAAIASRSIINTHIVRYAR